MAIVGNIVGDVVRPIVGSPLHWEYPEPTTLQQLTSTAIANLTPEGIVESGGSVVAMCNTKPSGVKFAQCLGASGDYYSTPDSAVVSITGDLDLRTDAVLPGGVPSSRYSIMGRWLTASNQRSYLLTVETDGKLRLWISSNGSLTAATYTSTLIVPIPADGRLWVRCTLDADTGASDSQAEFFTSSDGGSWTALGDPVLGGAAVTVFGGTAALEVGSHDGGTAALAGTLYRALVYDGIDGTLVADFNPNDYPDTGNPNWRASATGEVWTINGDNYVVTPRVMVGTGTPWAMLSGGAGSYFSTPATAAFQVPNTLDGRIHLSMTDWTPAGAQVFFGKYGAAGVRSYLFYVGPTTGLLNLITSSDGTAVIGHTSTQAPAVSDGEPLHLRFVFEGDNGAGGHSVTFYTSQDGVSWSVLGDPIVTAGTTSLFDTSASLEIGTHTGGTSFPLNGNVFRCELRDGVDGTAVVDFDPVMHTHGGTLPGRTGELWTANGGAQIEGYDMNVVVGTGANLRRSISDACLMYGATGDFASTPNSAANQITGDIEFIARISPDTILAEDMIVAKWDDTGRRAYALRKKIDGKLDMWTSPTGTSSGQYLVTSTEVLPFTDGDTFWVKATKDVDNGAGQNITNFYYSADATTDPNSVSWTALGSPIPHGGVTSIFPTTSIVEVGSFQTLANFLGTIHRVQVYNGIGGTLALDFNPVDYVNRASDIAFPSALTGETWTLVGDAFIQNTGKDVVHSIGAAALESTSETVISTPAVLSVVARFSDSSPAGNQYLVDSRSGSQRTIIGTLTSNSSRFSFYAGTAFVPLTQSYDTDGHVHLLQANSDATASLKVSRLGEIEGDGGANDLGYLTLFADNSGVTVPTAGYVGQLVLFDRATNDRDATLLLQKQRQEFRF